MNSDVPVQVVLDTLAALDLGAHVDPVASHLCDNGFEDFVPVSSLVKLLREAGVLAARAIAVKNTITTNRASEVPVCCASAIELLCVRCHGGRWCFLQAAASIPTVLPPRVALLPAPEVCPVCVLFPFRFQCLSVMLCADTC